MKQCLERSILLLLALYILSSCAELSHITGAKKSISPFDFGWSSSKTGIEQYEALLNTHRAAITAGVNVDYSGIDTIRIEFPRKPYRIPLSLYNDFKGCVFIVKNNVGNCCLFNIANSSSTISIGKKSIDSGDFRSYSSLRKGKWLLIIEDENPWVLNRSGHSYSHIRKDVLLIKKGRAINSVTMSYDNDNSQPKCSVIKVNRHPLVIKNINIIRDSDCTFVTHIAQITGFNNVIISNVSINTPQNALSGDQGIRIYDCSNVSLNNVHIDGTYSQKNKYGYGISLNNVWNFTASDFYGFGNWGVFGNNNVNTAHIKNSALNRFDIHCYGKDVFFSRVAFSGLYNQFASVYGTILFEKSVFLDFIPMINGGSYNSYVPHDIVFNDCIINATPSKNYLFKMVSLGADPNPREELSVKCLPNISVRNLTIHMNDGLSTFYLFRSESAIKTRPLGYISNISISGLKIVSDGTTPIREIGFSNENLNTREPVGCSLSNVVIIQPDLMTKLSSKKNQEVLLKPNLRVKGGSVVFKNTSGIIQKDNSIKENNGKK